MSNHREWHACQEQALFLCSPSLLSSLNVALPSLFAESQTKFDSFAASFTLKMSSFYKVGFFFSLFLFSQSEGLLKTQRNPFEHKSPLPVIFNLSCD